MALFRRSYKACRRLSPFSYKFLTPASLVHPVLGPYLLEALVEPVRHVLVAGPGGLQPLLRQHGQRLPQRIHVADHAGVVVLARSPREAPIGANLVQIKVVALDLHTSREGNTMPPRTGS
jgi:hypothetical protein